MKSAGLTQPQDYLSREVFLAERERIFGDCWFCVGTEFDLAKEGDYIAGDLAGLHYFVRRAQDGLRAFINVCSHRQALLLKGECGSGPVVCRYHGWGYDHDGVPTGIPENSRLFCLTDREKKALRLTSLRVESCGKFVFVSAPSCRSELSSFLGNDVAARLAAISARIATRYMDTAAEIRANWKICIENSLDDYHTACVHPKTLGKRGLLSPSRFTYETLGPHSRMAVPVVLEDDLDVLYQSGFSTPQAREQVHELYSHLYLFPNSTVSTLTESAVHLMIFNPTGEGATRVLGRGYLMDGPLSGAGVRRQQLLREYLFQSILAEDRMICEQVQAGIGSTDRKAVLGALEHRILHFQRTYRERLV